MVYNWLNCTLDWLLPATCRLCLAAGHNQLELCRDCLADLPRIIHACRRCARPLPDETGPVCGRCQRHPPAFDQCSALFRYQYPVDDLIKRIKFQQDLALLRSLGKLLSLQMQQQGYQPDLLLPVPLHWRRLAERGYNQALELARPCARDNKLSLDYRICKRRRATAAQSGLPARQRRRNMRGAFVVNREVTDLHITLIDDVLTTGSTLGELAKVLKQAGARRVDAWVIART